MKLTLGVQFHQSMRWWNLTLLECCYHLQDRCETAGCFTVSDVCFNLFPVRLSSEIFFIGAITDRSDEKWCLSLWSEKASANSVHLDGIPNWSTSTMALDIVRLREVQASVLVSLAHHSLLKVAAWQRNTRRPAVTGKF